MKRKQQHLLAIVAAIGALELCAHPGFGANTVYSYTGGGTNSAPITGDWNTAGNWSTNSIPTPSTTTELDFGGSAASAYTSTNDIATGTTSLTYGSNSSFTSLFVLNEVQLFSSASVAELIAGNGISFQGTAPSIVQNGSGAVTFNDPIDLSLAGSNGSLTFAGTGSGNVLVSTILYDPSGSSSGTTPIFANDSGSGTVTISTIIPSSSASNNTAHPIVLEGSNAGANTVSSALSDYSFNLSRTQILRKSGTGQWVLTSGLSSYTNTTTVQDGTLTVAAGAGIGFDQSRSQTAFASGATTIPVSSAAGIFVGEVVTANAAGTIPSNTTVSAVDYVNNTVTISAPTTAAGNTSNDLQFRTNATVAAGTSTTTISNLPTTTGLLIGQQLTGVPGVSGNATITAINGPTSITVSFTGTASAGTGKPISFVGALGDAATPVALSAGTATANPSLMIGGAYTIGRQISIAPAGSTATSGVYRIGGNTDASAAFSGAISTASSFSITQVATTGTDALNITGGITSAATTGLQTVTFAATGTEAVSSTAIADGTSGGQIAVSKTGPGSLLLSSTSTYTGATTISAGTLLLTGGLGNTAIAVNASGATFAVNPSNGGSVNIGTTTAGAGASLSLVSGAVFDMSGDAAAGTAAFQQGSGFSGPALTTAGATFKFDLLNVTADKLAVNGIASVSGTNLIGINTSAATSLTPGTYPLITAASGLTGTFSFLDGNPVDVVSVGGTSYDLSLTNSDTAESLNVTAAPEPSSIALIGIMTALPLLRRRRKSVYGLRPSSPAEVS